MEREIYTRSEQIMIEGAKLIQAKQDTAAALRLDLMLLEMESEFNMMDGVRYE